MSRKKKLKKGRKQKGAEPRIKQQLNKYYLYILYVNYEDWTN